MKIHFAFIFVFCPLAEAFSQQTQSPLIISKLTDNFYIYQTFSEYKGSRIPANGMYVVTHQGVVIIDSPWDTTQFQPLLDSIKKRHNKNAEVVLATHFHDDRTAGLEYYASKGIKTYTTKATDDLSKKTGKKRAQFIMRGDTTFQVGQYRFDVYFPGHGHTPDNVVVWFPGERVLYGGCLIKSVDDATLGNLNDADPDAYPATVKNVEQKFKNPRYVIPGHNRWTDTEALAHTQRMATKLRSEKGKK
ncbi:MAG TPA: BlaB/IND/MUS family subclass B1 metallo-beta-lactamase [Chryseosolibacter sp.]